MVMIDIDIWLNTDWFHINMFWHHYLGNKEPPFLTCNPEQIYAAMLESLKNNDIFKNRQSYSRGILEFSEISLTWFL